MNAHLGLEPKLVAISLVLAAGVFVLDIVQPLGVAAGILYVAVVLVGLWSRVHAFVYILAGLASVLTVWGFYASPGDQGSWLVLENRGLALFAIWAVTLAGSRRVSDLENADQALQESEQRYSLAAGLAGVTVWEMVPEEGRLILNDDFGNTFQEAENVTSNLVDDWVSQLHPDDQKAARRDIQSIVDGTADSFDLEFRVLLEDGTVVWRQCEASRASAPGEKPVRIIGTSRDITERKQVEADLRLSEASLENAQRIAELGSWDWDIATNTGHWSDELYRIFGMEPQETEADFDLFMELVHPDDRDLISKAVEDALSGERPYQLDHRLVRRDGKVRFVKETAEVRRDGNGTPISMHGTVQDITELKVAEEALRESERRLQDAHRIAKLGDWALDSETRVFTFYGGFYAQFSFSHDGEEVKTSFEDALVSVHPGDAARVRADFERCFAEGVPYDRTNRYVNAAGENGYARLIGEVVRDGTGAIVGMHGTTQDVTTLLKAEIELRESEQRLQRAHRISKLSHWEFDLGSRCFKAYGDMYADFGLGGKETEFSFEDALQPVHPDDVARVRAAFERSFTQGVPFDETDRVVYDDGRVGHMRLIGEVIRDDTGSVVGMRGTTQDVTEQMQAQESLKRHEAQLRESEQRLQEAHRIASLTHWEFDLSANHFSAFGEVINDLEPSAESGKYTAKEAFGLILPEDAQRVGRAFERTRSDGTPYNETYRVRDTDGAIIHLHSLGEAVRDETGSVVAIRGTSQDVTATVEAEAELRESQRRLLDAQRIADLGNWVFDVATGHYSVLGEFFEQYDFPMDDEQAAFSLEAGLAVVHPDDLEVFRSCLDRCLIDGTTFDVMVRSLTADGQTFHLHVIGEAVHDEAGSVVEIRGTTQDITAQKTVEDELRISQAGLENAQRIARMGNWDWNIETGELRWSDEIYRIFGQTPQSFGATYDAFIDIVHPDDREMVRDSVDAAVQKSDAYNLVHRIVLPDGQIRTVHEEGEVAYTEDGTPLHMTGVVKDVTEQVQMEDQLRHAQKMETVGQLSAGVAHDFNNMLSVIMGNLELAQRRIHGDPQVETLLEAALAASHRGAELTHSLLAFSRKQVLFPKPVDINKSAEGVLALAKRTVAKTVDIMFEPLADLWAAEVDPAHLESAILNLVVNACAAMPIGGKLKISTWNASQLDPAHGDDKSWPTADYVCLAITDIGHGMTPEVLERAVEPFFTTKGMAQGSGLGLSMVYGFVEQSGGLFDIVSEPGVGTKVTLSLPRSGGILSSEEEQEPKGQRDENARTVLLVEDEPRVMETVAFQLSDLGFRVLVAPDAEQALRLLGQKTGVDLLFADVVLGPGKNGIDLAIEAKQKYPNLKVLCTSGYAGDELIARFEGAQDMHILAKPFTLDQLAARLDEVLRIDA